MSGALLLLVTWRAGLWEFVPPLLWVASAALFLVACALAARRLRELPLAAGPSTWRRWGSLAASCAFAAACVAVLAAALSRIG